MSGEGTGCQGDDWTGSSLHEFDGQTNIEKSRKNAENPTCVNACHSGSSVGQHCTE